jgi:hypothetical protein
MDVVDFGFVDKYYVMDPMSEELLFDGTALQEGMRVLIERTESREEITERMAPGKLDNARWNNRWCTIKQIDIRGENVSFLAVYDDHTVKKRVHNVHFPWLVKIDSLPDPKREKHDAIYRLVYQGLQYESSLAYTEEATPGDNITKRAGNVTDKILELL